MGMVPYEVATLGDGSGGLGIGLGPSPLDEKGCCVCCPAQLLDQGLLDPGRTVAPARVLGIERQGDLHRIYAAATVRGPLERAAPSHRFPLSRNLSPRLSSRPRWGVDDGIR